MDSSIEMVRRKCQEKLRIAYEFQDSESINKYNIINTFLINDRCFLNIDRTSSISLLKLLDYSEEEAYMIYEDLISYENVKGEFVFEEDIKGGKKYE